MEVIIIRKRNITIVPRFLLHTEGREGKNEKVEGAALIGTVGRSSAP